MTAGSTVDDAPEVTIETDVLSQKRKTRKEPSSSEGSIAAEDTRSKDSDSHGNDYAQHTESVLHKQKGQGNSGYKVYHSEKSTKVNKRDTDDSLEQRDLKEMKDVELRDSRSSSRERSQKERSTERQVKRQDERPRSLLKEKRDRSSSTDVSERSTSKSSMRSRDKRDRSKSVEKNRKHRRHRSHSSEEQDHSRSAERRRNRKRSRSPTWRSKDRRNRSRSVSQGKGKERSWSRSRDRNYSYRSHRSPVRDSYGRTRRDTRDRRARSRSGSYERTRDTRRRGSTDSPARTSRNRKKSKSPDKKDHELKSDSKDSTHGDTSSKREFETLPTFDLASIPVLDEIPLPDAEMQKSIPSKSDEVQLSQDASSTDVLQESIEISDETNEVTKTEPQVNSTKDLDIAEDSQDKSTSGQEDVSKEKTMSMLEQKNQNINPATLASGKDRQIKFSIMGSQRKLKPIVVTDILHDDDDDTGDDNDALTEKAILKPELIVEGAVLIKTDIGQPTQHRSRKHSAEDVESIRDLEVIDHNDPLRKTPIETSLVSLPIKGHELPDSPKIEVSSEKVDISHQKIPDGNNQRNTASPSSSKPQRLKFKYTPLWEMEKDDKPPVIEEVSTKKDSSRGLALDYGSESSDYDEEEEGSLKKTSEKLIEQVSVDAQKDVDILVAKDESGKIQIEEKIEVAESVDGLTKDIETSAEDIVDAKISSEVYMQEEALPNVEEECPNSEAVELSSDGHDSSVIPSETDKEAYSPSHPSMDDVEDLVHVGAAVAAKDKELEVKHLPKLDDRATSYASHPGIPSHQLPGVGVATPAVANMLGSVASANFASIPLPGILQPVSSTVVQQMTQISMKPHELTVPQINTRTSLVGQTFPGLPIPFSHSSLLHPTLSLPPQPVPPPLPGMQQTNASFSQPTAAPKPVPPPSQHNITLPQNSLPFGVVSLSSSHATAPQATSAWGSSTMPLSGISLAPDKHAQVLGVHGVFGFQEASLPGLRGIPPLAASSSEVTPLASVHPVGGILTGSLPLVAASPICVLPTVVAAQSGSLLAVPAVAQSTSSSFATVEGSINNVHLQRSAPDTVPSATPPVKYRINRFHQGPSLARDIPPPSIAIPQLALPLTLGASTAALGNIPATVPFISVMTPLQPPTTSAVVVPVFLKSEDNMQPKTSRASQKPPIATVTHSKRPKISSILSQPIIQDPIDLQELGVVDVKLRHLATEGRSTAMKSQSVAAQGVGLQPPTSTHGVNLLPPTSAHDADFLPSTSSSSHLTEKHPEVATDSAIEKIKPVEDKPTDSSSHQHKEVSTAVAAESSVHFSSIVAEEDHSVELAKEKPQQREAIKPSLANRSHPLEEVTEELVSTSTQSVEIDMGNIPLPGELPSSMEPEASPPDPPQPSGKDDSHLPPSLLSKLSSLPAAMPDFNPSFNTLVTSLKEQTLGSLLAERKKRFSQSPLSIGMLPKVQITQSPLAAGPLPKLPPEPAENKTSAVTLKKSSATFEAVDVKPITQLSLVAKPKKPLMEKEESKTPPKVHFVFKSKPVVQKTLISAFDDDASDGSEGVDHQATSSEPSHFENSISSLFADDRKEPPHPTAVSSLKAAVPTTETEKEGQMSDKEATVKENVESTENRPKFVSLTDMEAFPVQVITSSRKEEVTPSSSWPEFTVGKKEKRDEELDRDEKRSRDREDRSKRKSRFSRDRDRHDNRDERKRRNKYDADEDKKTNTRKKEDGRRSEDDEDSLFDAGIRIKKEKEDFYEDRLSSGQDDSRSGQQKSNNFDDDEDRRRGRDGDNYSKKRNMYNDDSEYRKGKSRDEKYSRRRGDDRDDYNRRKHDNDDSRRMRSFERDRSRERERTSGKSGGKRSHKNREKSHSRSRSRSPSRRRGRDRSQDRYDRDKNRSRSRERGLSASSRRKDMMSFKEELLEELTKPSNKSDSKDELFKVTVIGSSNQTSQPYAFDYPIEPIYSSAADSNVYPQHGSEVSGGYPGQDTNCVPQYPPQPYENQQYGPQWPGQPVSNTFHNQVPPPQHHQILLPQHHQGLPPQHHQGLPPQHHQILHPQHHQFQPPPHHQQPQHHQLPHQHHQIQPSPHQHHQVQQPQHHQILPPQHQDLQYPPVSQEKVLEGHLYPFQPQNSHYPQPNYPTGQLPTDPYQQITSILHQLPQMQHPISGPQPPHILFDQHGQPIPPRYPAPPPHQVSQHFTQSGPPSNFQPHSFTQESMPSFMPPDFHLHQAPRPRAPLLPNPVRSPLLRTPLNSQSVVEASNFVSPRFSSPEPVSSPSLQKQSDTRPAKKVGSVDEGTFSPVIKSSVSASSSPSVGSPSTSNISASQTSYTKPTTVVPFSTSALTEPSFETSLLAETEFDSLDTQEGKKASKVSISKKKNNLEVNEPTVSSSGVEDSTGDTGSDSGTDSSSQKPLKVKSRWRRNSEAEAVVDTSTPPTHLAKQLQSKVSTQNDTPDSSPKERRRTRSRTAAEEFSSAAAALTETPPPPPPPRKRIKVEIVAPGLSEEPPSDASKILPEEGSTDMQHEIEDLASLIARPDFPKFEIIDENIHLTERKRSKSMKRMLCDCTTSREERSKEIVPCGSDCLNRMLMIECGSRCPCGDYCTNKRFQKKQYSKTSPFKAGDKGWGLIAGEDMEEKGTFLMEYVGELLDYEEFVRRTRQYSKAGLVHHYFMALNADEVVDATLKGNISRFINHSCDPNCETQKWTVNGELRVGFFTRKQIKRGEELTFDYQFEHYGEAQKCYCGAENCRGYIGLVKSPTRNNRRKEKKKKELFKDELLEEDIAKISLLDGMRNKNHVLDLCRLMVRAEKVQHRMEILNILQDTTESACLRLFLDYHGLPLLWSWMADIGTTDYSAHTQELKLLMLSVLKSLPITNKTALKESKIPDMVDRWAVAAVVAARKPPPPPPPATTAPAIVTMTTAADEVMPNTTALIDNEAVASSETTSSLDEATLIEEDAEKAAAEPEATTSSESSPPASPSPPLFPLLSTITPVSILASAKDTKDAKRKRRVTFAEIPVESVFSPEPPQVAEENDDISSSTQSTGEKEGLEDVRAQVESGNIDIKGLLPALDLPGEAAASKDRAYRPDDMDLLTFDLKSDESLSSNVADSTSQKYNFDSSATSCLVSDTDNSDTETLIKDPLASLAAECVSLWSSLKEVFKIPKRERVEERKRTERELDVMSKKDLETSDPFAKWKRSKVMRLSKKKSLDDDDKKFCGPKMSKEERRQLFEAQVKAEDEMVAQAYADEYQRQQEAYILHQQRLMEDPQYFYFHQQQTDPNFAGMDPNMIPSEGLTDPITGQPIINETIIDPHTGQPVIDPNSGQPMIDPNNGQPLIDQNTGQPLILHPIHIDHNTGQPIVHPHHIDPQTGQQVHHLDQMTGQLVQHLDPLTGQLVQHLDPLTGHPVHQIDPITGQPVTSQIDPHTGQPIQHQMDPLMSHQNVQTVHTQFDPHLGQPIQHQHTVHGQTTASNFQQQPPLQHLPVSSQSTSLLDIEYEDEVPPPPSPPTVPVNKLPPNWKTAKDSEGRIYYYHAFTRQTQWEIPNWDDDDDSDDMDLDPIPMDEIMKSKKKTTTAAADTSSEVARKIKDQFRSKMSNFIVTYLNPYRKQDCKIGRIVSTDDFKHLARKLTHHVMSKELKHCRHVEDLEVNENVKAKAKDYVRKYMSKFGSTYKKTSSPLI